jgi:glycosyltransferase involved in cell wall biosynthesis
MRKRICFVTTVPITIKAFLLGLSMHLIKHYDYDVTFICNDDEYLRSITNENLHFIPVKMKRGVGYDGIRVIWKLYKIFKREKYDIVQYATPNASLYASIAAKFAGIKGRLYCQWGVRYIDFTGLARIFYRLLVKIMCNNATDIEVESYSILKFSLGDKLYMPEKASVIWNGSASGVDLEKFNYGKRNGWRKEIRSSFGISEDTMVFGYAGRITRDKGINELVDSFCGIKDSNKAVLFLVGDYDNAGTMRPDIIEKIENSINIVRIPFTNQLERYYAAMDVFCSLSYREGFGLVVIEAGAIGTPGIVSNVPGQFDTIKDGVTGILAEVRNVDSIRNCIETYIGNPNMCMELGKNAVSYVSENYDSVKLFDKLAVHRNEIIRTSAKY